jgi:hypothetical protein
MYAEVIKAQTRLIVTSLCFFLLFIYTANCFAILPIEGLIAFLL